jgi:hypothetical protein
VSRSRLGRAEFDAAVRQALRDLGRPDLSVQLPDLPSGTYRRHLTQGVSRITSRLWDRENAPSTNGS